MDNKQELPTSYFSGLDIFSGIDDQDLYTLTEGYILKKLSRGDILFKQFSQADYFFIILKGHLKIVKSIQDRKTILTILCPGEVAAALLMTKEDSSFPGDVVALNECKVALIPKVTYQKNWMTHLKMAENVQRCVQRRLRSIQEDRSAQFLNIKGRLAIFLLRYFTDETTYKSSEIKLTRLELATAVGAEPETVIRTMKSLERAGLISIDHGKVCVLKPLELAELTNPKSA